ncbi:MAG: hypothetical protein E4H03_11160 [Myxococcales bacterium]|nr:MAG: hypothetical protein E4H03_11160 [Myxococcales bacterium]
MRRPDRIDDAPSGSDRLTRLVRISLITIVQFALEWRLMDPGRIATAPELRPMPWAILALLVPTALGVWAFELATRERAGFKADFLWGVLVASLAYVGALLALR